MRVSEALLTADHLNATAVLGGEGGTQYELRNIYSGLVVYRTICEGFMRTWARALEHFNATRVRIASHFLAFLK